MLATAIIVFREVLEAALVVGIVLAASRGVRRRGLWVAGGVGAGVLGAMVVAGFAGEIAAAVDGVGQELFNAAILFAAVAMLGWHNVWMSRHGRALANEATRVGRGRAPARSRFMRWRSWSGSRRCAKAPRSCCSSMASPWRAGSPRPACWQAARSAWWRGWRRARRSISAY